MEKKNIILSLAVAIVAIPAGYYFFTKAHFQNERSLGVILEKNGYVEFKPPSKLVTPGTWVSTNGETPLNLSIICQPIDALGIEPNSLISSASIDTELTANLDQSFEIDAKLLKSIKSKNDLKDIESVSLKLTNVKIVEIADNVVHAGIANRSKSCRDAISYRLANDFKVTMIKSALYADVTYVAKLRASLSGVSQANVERELASALKSKIDSTDKETITLSGRQLIWGVRDDISLAKVGIGLPNTGGTSDTNGLLQGLGPVESVLTDEQVRRTFPTDHKFASYDVIPIKQTGSMDCWATVYTMMISWRDKTDYTIASALSNLPDEYSEYYAKNRGLPGGQENAFVENAGMTARPPAAYFLFGYVNMLRDHGPLWIITGDGISSHAKLLIGIYGPSLEEKVSAYEKAIFEFIDPLNGSYEYQTAFNFMDDFEKEARWIVDTRQDDQDLRWQILHF